MKSTLFLISAFFLFSLTPGLCFAQNKVVVIPLMETKEVCAIPTVTTATGRVWMDRNLGSPKVAQAPLDYAAFGWLYQWGRLPDGHEGVAHRYYHIHP